MIWAAISCYSAGLIIILHGRITASDYVDISRNHVHPIVQMFRKNDTIFHYENSPMPTARSAQSWFKEHERALQQLLWPAQLPDISIIKTVVSFRG